MNIIAFSNHLQNVQGRLTASTPCPGTSDVRLWHLRGKQGFLLVKLCYLDSWTTFWYVSILYFIFYCNSFRVIHSIKLIYLNVCPQYILEIHLYSSPFFVDGELRPLKQEIYLESSELVPSHSSFLMFLHLHRKTQKIPGMVKIW